MGGSSLLKCPSPLEKDARGPSTRTIDQYFDAARLLRERVKARDFEAARQADHHSLDLKESIEYQSTS